MRLEDTKPAVKDASKRPAQLCLNCGGVYSGALFSPCCIAPMRRYTLAEAHALLNQRAA